MAMLCQVQPVAPVLNETREMVKLFNRLLGAKVRAQPGLRFLDIMSGLLTADGAALHADFELDGTHMSPRYVRLIEQALNDGPGPYDDPLPTPSSDSAAPLPA
jgi:hypothetical protein